MKAWMQAAVLAATATVAGGASAQTYVQGNYGWSHLSASCAGTTSCENNEAGAKLLVGVQVKKYLALELGYIRFGRAFADVLDGSSNITRNKLETDAFFVAGALRLPMAELEVPEMTAVVRFGSANVSNKLVYRSPGASSDAWETNARPRVLFGFGLEYKFTPQWGMNVGADFTRMAKLDRVSSGNLRLISLGAQYNF
ncbi:MAG: OmpA-like transrane domain [Pseudomonadota bacterium]|jgi:opacity protein-like surface antigen